MDIFASMTYIFLIMALMAFLWWLSEILLLYSKIKKHLSGDKKTFWGEERKDDIRSRKRMCESSRENQENL